jgi:hypothetical protein
VSFLLLSFLSKYRNAVVEIPDTIAPYINVAMKNPKLKFDKLNKFIKDGITARIIYIISGAMSLKNNKK